jgi:hypothetical protein
MSAFLNQKLGQKPGSTNTPVVDVTIVKPLCPRLGFSHFYLGSHQNLLSARIIYRWACGQVLVPTRSSSHALHAPKRSGRPWKKLARANGA